MSVRVGYSGDQLLISDLKCNCPMQHSTPMQDIYVGSGLIQKIPGYIKQRELGKRCVLVADKNTYKAAGKSVHEVLSSKGFKVTLCVLLRDGELEPDERAVGEVLMAMTMNSDFFISVGSGSITDTTRTVAAQTERPFVCVGTAPSMDGYTSVVAPMLLRGVKVHVQSICPEIIVCDLDVLRTAPLDMYISGVGDVLGKFIAKADWAISNIVTGEAFCPTCAKIVIDAVHKLLANIDEIRERTERGTRILIEALLLSGITIMIIGNTRAVASVEHNIAHYWEMQQLLAGKAPPSHGASVGVATLLVWPYFEAFKRLDPKSLDIRTALDAALTKPQRETFMIGHYGDAAARAIMKENPADFLTEAERRRRFEAIVSGFDRIKAELELLPAYDTLRDAMVRLGAPLTPKQIGIPDAMLRKSLDCAKDYRTRYTLFKSIDELGLGFASPKFDRR